MTTMFFARERAKVACNATQPCGVPVDYMCNCNCEPDKYCLKDALYRDQCSSIGVCKELADVEKEALVKAAGGATTDGAAGETPAPAFKSASASLRQKIKRRRDMKHN